MVALSAYFESSPGVPLTSPANVPTITIVDETDVVTQAAIAGTELANQPGTFVFDFTAFVAGREYHFRWDGDPTAAGQVPADHRFQTGAVSGDDLIAFVNSIPDILVDTGTTIPALIAALNNLSIADVQTALTNQGYTAARAINLDNLDDSISNVRSDIANIAAVTRFRTSIPKVMEIPAAGSRTYRIHVNLEDTEGNPEDPDANTITVNAFDATGASRDSNLSSTTMTRESEGRYRVDYSVPSTHAIEQVRFQFTYDENAVTFVKDGTTSVLDSDVIGFTSTDRTALNDVLNDTAAMEPLVTANLDAAISAVLTAITGLNNISIADVQTALTNQGYTTIRAALLDFLDAAITSRSSHSAADVDTVLTAAHGVGSWQTGAAAAAQLDLRQAWTNFATGLRAIVHLEQNGERVTLPSGGTPATLAYQGYDRAGNAIAGFSGSGTLRVQGSDTWFDIEQTYTPTAGEVITIRCTISDSGIGGGTHNGMTEVAFPSF